MLPPIPQIGSSRTLGDDFRAETFPYTDTPLYRPTRRESTSLLYQFPQEIINMISRHIPYKDLLLLQALSRRLRYIIDPLLASEASKIGLVMRAENYKRHYEKKNGEIEKLGCFVCYRVIDVREFAGAEDQTLVDPFARHLAGQPLRHLRRFCIKCGVKKGYHNPGDVLDRRDHTTWWVCDCRHARDKATMACDRCGMNAPMRKPVSYDGWEG